MKYIKHIILTAMAVVVMTGAWAQTEIDPDPYTPTQQTDGSWMFTMPAANKLLEVQYQYTLTLSHNAGHGTVEIISPGGSTGNVNIFNYCYDCSRHPAYPKKTSDNNNIYNFSNPYVGLNGIGTANNSSTGPWKLEYVGQYSHSEYNFSVSSIRSSYGLSSDENIPIFLLYQWDGTRYQPVVYGVACAYNSNDHTLLFVAEGNWGCFLSDNSHSQNVNMGVDEDLSNGLPGFVTAATPSLPEGVTDNHNGTYTVVSGTELTIEAIANTAEHYYFDNWTNEQGSKYTTGVVTPTGSRPATSLLTLTITGDTTVRGNFRIDTFDLKLSTNNANMGHIDIGGQQYESKDTMLTDHQHIDVAAIPESGYYFVNWTDANGIEKSKNTHIMVTAISDTTLTANFAPYAILQIASNNNAWGTVALQAGTTGNHELTLYDESESTSNQLIPAYTYWFDALTRSQHVIPATKLAEIKGGTISSIKYYAQQPVTWTSSKNIDVYLKEVTGTTLNSLVEKSSCTLVYNGTLNVNNGIVTITFSSPFSYNGGDLLVGIENLEEGNYNSVSFLGEDVPGASIGGRGGNFTQQNFLPMSTFTYQTAGAIENTNGSYSVIPGTEVTVTATPANDYHFVNWTDENSNVMGTDAQMTFTVTGDTAVTGNFAVRPVLKLATNDPAMGTVKIDSAKKTIIPYNSIESDSCSGCKICWPGEGSDKLFDGNTSSGKWSTDSTVKFVVFHTNTPVQVNGYTLFTGNDNANEHGRNPKSWVLKAKLASTDGWTTVATVTNDQTMQDVNYTPFDFEMDVPGTYQYFRFEVSALRGDGNFMQLGEMQLFKKRAISFLDSVSVKNAAANEYYVLPGAKVAVKAIPAAGYQLLKWEDNSTDLDRTVTVTGDTTALATFGLPTPGVTPEGNLTVFGGRFLSETGEIVATPALTETGELIDESAVPVPVFTCPATVKDTNDNVYEVVKLGNQCWMKSNLRTMNYPDGSNISASNMANPNNTTANGLLYSWSAVMHGASSSSANPSGVQGICPRGWHVPSDAEWTQMTDYVSSQSDYQCGASSDEISKALASKTLWKISTTSSCTPGNSPQDNDATGFSAIPAGGVGTMTIAFGENAVFWSSTEKDNSSAYFRSLFYNSSTVTAMYRDKNYKFSVRCVRDEE